ncbi:Ig-like domain-containing protein [Haloferula sp. A504]|uniref:Ig-like domain-containing protein n=1 Tax=Haloferula sp. A504 TaxID=3373601 RepID=UPI0031BD6F2B|nr:Ig-like domain-containing protein [Verrucomicrobiaceae bacterium E54]
MKPKNLLTLPAIFALFSLPAVGDVITPVGATSTTGIGGTDPRDDIAQAINSSGLVDVSDPSSELDDTHTSGFGTDYWMSENGSPAAGGEVLEFDLGSPFDVNGLYYWAYNRTADRSMRTFDISYSTDGGTTFTTPVSAASLGMADWTIGLSTNTVSTVESRSFNTTLAGVTNIRFSNLQNYGSTSYYTLAEIRFEGTVPAAGTVDADTSTVEASPSAVLADGTSASTITVTLKDASGVPVGSEDVTLANTSGPGTPTISPSATQTTDATGVATFTVSSNTVGTEVFTATSSTDSVTVTQTASVDFQSPVVDAGNSSVSASPTSVPANDVSTSTVTVMLRNGGGLVLPGKLVSLAGDGENDVTPAGTATTDANGEATFTVKSGTAGLETFTATSEAVTITATAGVDFSEVPSGGYITPTGATSTSTVGSPRTIDKAIDGSGLTDVLDPSSVLDDSHAYDTSAYWLSASTAVSAGDEELTFNLGGSFDVDKVYYWTYERDGDRNLRTFDISFSTDGGGTFSTPVPAASLNMADWAIGGNDRAPSFARTATFDTLSGITHIRFSNLQNHGDPSYFALYELRFGGPPVPALITDFQAEGAAGTINQAAKTITVEVPFGTDLSNLAPTFTLSSGDCIPASGSPPSPTFAVQNPATYTVTDTATDPDTVNTYTVTVTVGPEPPPTLVIDLGAGTTIEAGEFISGGPIGLPLPTTLPTGSILRSIAFNDVTLTATDSGSDGNYASDLTVLLGPPGTAGGDFSLAVTSVGANQDFGVVGDTLVWSGGNDGIGTSLTETKTDADWTGDIDLATTALFLGNGYRGFGWETPQGGTWTGTITLTYDDVGTGTSYAGWSGGAAAEDDTNGDGVANAVAYALGAADVNENAIGLLPAFDNSDPANFVFTFDRSDAAETDASTTITVEYGTDLSGWTAAPNAGDGVTVDDSGASVGGLTPVVVTIPKTVATDGKLFARLKVAVSP